MSSRSSSSGEEDAGVISDHSEGEIRSRSSTPARPPSERESRPRERAPIDSTSCLSKYYRERFGSHSPEDYLNLRFSKMNPRLGNDDIKKILEEELRSLGPFEIKVVKDPETDDRLAYVNFRRNNCAKTVRRALIPNLQDRLGDAVLIDPAGVLRDQEGKFIPDRFNRAQMSDGHPDTRVPYNNHHQARLGPSHHYQQHHHNNNNNKGFNNLNQEPKMATRTLFVGNLPGDVKQDELMRVFGKFGTIEDIDIKVIGDKTAAFAFVVFHSLDVAIDALETMHNRPVRKGSSLCQIGYGKSQVSPKLWVGRLGAWANKDMLVKEFDRYGVVESVEFNYGDHHAYVKFSDSNSARDACLALKDFALDGRHRIVVDYAKERGNQRRFDRNERPDRMDFRGMGRNDRFERVDRMDRGDYRMDRVDRMDRVERVDRVDRMERIDVRKRAKPEPRSLSPEEVKRKRREKTKSRSRSRSPKSTYDEFNEKYPSTWKGFFCLKKTEYNIKIHRVAGKENLVQDLMRNDEGGAIKLKIDQRLPRETMFLEKLLEADKGSLVFMVGAEVAMSFTPFIEYMNDKDAFTIQL
ncbi:unnamed protein product [Bursaphelenchus okinawaensis]|uniref:RNA-binding protein n=1 Tax=Bursaphelenchus okinawaensis TaxID=465554 RepID=A0A811KTJ6_9BILA|nr:unnamed protein product [Bursaphelenchus okinawaensis]CAG9112348.1 unnamed protein product [Bursaphelenchus okinawaensis]